MNDNNVFSKCFGIWWGWVFSGLKFWGGNLKFFSSGKLFVSCANFMAAFTSSISPTHSNGLWELCPVSSWNVCFSSLFKNKFWLLKSFMSFSFSKNGENIAKTKAHFGHFPHQIIFSCFLFM